MRPRWSAASWVGKVGAGSCKFPTAKVRSTKSIKDFHFEFSLQCLCIIITIVCRPNLEFTHTVTHYSASVCIRKLHFKIHSVTTLLCSVQPGFLKLRVNIPFLWLWMLFMRKIFDDTLSSLQSHNHRYSPVPVYALFHCPNPLSSCLALARSVYAGPTFVTCFNALVI